MQDWGRRFLKIFLLFPAWLKLGSVKWAYRLAEENFSMSELEGLAVKEGELVSLRSGVKVTEQSYPLLKGGMRYWKGFASYEGVSFFGIRNNKLMAEVDGIWFQVDHAGSLFVLEEIFAERLYDLRVNEELVLVDVGMNVGIASLYFAAQSNVIRVFSYEPLKETYEQALNNFSLNPQLQSKIIPFQQGVSDYAGFIEVPGTVSGSAVFSTDKDFIETLGSRTNETVKVDIVPIHEVFKMIAAQLPGKRIFLKLDCEGEEYKIMDSLASQGHLERVSCIALEWHFKGFASLCELLRNHGFSVFNLGRTEIAPPCGMIYAVNMKTQDYA